MSCYFGGVDISGTVPSGRNFNMGSGIRTVSGKVVFDLGNSTIKGLASLRVHAITVTVDVFDAGRAGGAAGADDGAGGAAGGSRAA